MGVQRGQDPTSEVDGGLGGWAGGRGAQPRQVVAGGGLRALRGLLRCAPGPCPPQRWGPAGDPVQPIPRAPQPREGVRASGSGPPGVTRGEAAARPRAGPCGT